MSSTLDLLLKNKGEEAPAPTEAEDEVAIVTPATKSAVGKLKVAEADALASKLGIADTAWEALTLPDKKSMLNSVLFSEDGDAVLTVQEVGETDGEAPAEKAAPKAAYANDPLAKLAKEIEGLADQKEIEARIADTFKQDALNEFVLGGLFTKLNEIGEFGEFKNFAEYVEAKYDVKYRKARYLMAIYSSLIDLQIPYSEVQHVGWTKLKELVPILTADNYKFWIEKAVSMNTDTLAAEVKAAISGGTNDSTSENDAQPVKTVTSKTLKLHDDQLGTFNEAVAKAKGIIGTDSDTVAVDAIMVEYLGNASAKPAPKAADAEVVEKPILDPKAFWAALRAQFPDDAKSAMIFALGDDAEFDAKFPTVVLDVQFTDDND